MIKNRKPSDIKTDFCQLSQDNAMNNFAQICIAPKYKAAKSQGFLKSSRRCANISFLTEKDGVWNII